jgi:hypothetical protein
VAGGVDAGLVPLDPEGVVDEVDDEEPQPAAAASVRTTAKGAKMRADFMSGWCTRSPEQRLTG